MRRNGKRVHERVQVSPVEFRVSGKNTVWRHVGVFFICFATRVENWLRTKITTYLKLVTGIIKVKNFRLPITDNFKCGNTSLVPRPVNNKLPTTKLVHESMPPQGHPSGILSRHKLHVELIYWLKIPIIGEHFSTWHLCEKFMRNLKILKLWAED